MQQGERIFDMAQTSEIVIQNYNVTVAAPNGLGYGVGSIGVHERLDNPEDSLTTETLVITEQGINSPEAMQPITDRSSDGCGDGRGTNNYFVNGTIHEKALNRAKVFGGGLIMGAASLIGLGRENGKKLKNVIEDSQELFNVNGEDYGAHTADHAHGPDCGCGAIDRKPEILKNAVVFRDKIKANILALAGEDESSEVSQKFESTMDNIEQYLAERPDEQYTGSEIMEDIADNGKIIAELTDDHKEVAIVINADIKDKSFDQDLIRRITNGAAQVFAVDIPRKHEIADMFESEDDKATAFMSQMIYKLATAATLTKGDLPVFVIYENSSKIDFYIN